MRSMPPWSKLRIFVFAASVMASPSVALALADLTVAWTAAPSGAASGESIGVTFRVARSSGWPLLVVGRVGVYLSADSIITSGDARIGSTGDLALISNQTTSGSATAVIPGGTPIGKYYLGLIVDYANNVAESNETNNASSATTFYLGPNPTFNRFGSEVLGAPGGALKVTDQVLNLGSAVGPFTVGYYLSLDETITPSDTFLGVRSVSGLERGTTSYQNTWLALPPGVEGQWFLGAIIDPTNQIAEADEADNRSPAVAVTIDATPPAITIQGVSEGLVSGAQQLAACITVTDSNPGPVTATLDGVPLAGGCGTAVSEGDHVLAVHAVDLVGNVADEVVHFALDHTPPVTVVESPAEGEVVAASPAAVSIRAIDVHEVESVTVNGAAASRQLDGSFLANVELVEGANLLLVAGTDVAGNSSSAQVAVILDTVPPELAITSPTEGAGAAEKTIVLGTASDATAFTVNVGGGFVPVAADSTFATSVRLLPGPGVISAAAVDAAGNVTTVSRGVSVPYPEATLGVTDPLPGFETSSETIVVRGWAQSASPPITVVVSSLGVATQVLQATGSFALQVAIPLGDSTIGVSATDSVASQSSMSIPVRRSNAPEGCTCDASGNCTFAQGITRYCYDAAGNLTARLVAIAGGLCAAPSCP